MDQSLDKFIKRKAAFDPTDIFGKGRIRKLIYEYEDLKWRYKKELGAYRQTTVSQANAVTMMVEKLSKMEKENAYLKSYIKESDATKINLQQNRMAANKQVEELADENAKLKAELSLLREDYRQLADVHETLMQVIHEQRPDIDLDKLRLGKEM